LTVRRSWTRCFVASASPLALAAACSASNGEPIPSEIYDAQALDVGTVVPGRDGSPPVIEDSGAADAPPTDAAANDAPADAPQETSTSAVVRINEVYVDRIVAGDNTEYVELRGPDGTRVDDLFIRIIDDTGKASADIDVGTGGQTIGATGTWVIGTNALVGRVDRAVLLRYWGLDLRGAVELRRGPGKTLIDVVAWTDHPDGGGAPPGEGAPYLLPSGTTSFGRVAGAPDTDDNEADFCTMAKSVGAANTACQ
jgi:hypothetical protein